jgi:hypothetical protein
MTIEHTVTVSNKQFCKCGCGGIPKTGNTYINRHANKGRKFPNRISISRIGSLHPQWKGGRTKTSKTSGYWLIKRRGLVAELIQRISRWG